MGIAHFFLFEVFLLNNRDKSYFSPIEYNNTGLYKGLPISFILRKKLGCNRAKVR